MDSTRDKEARVVWVIIDHASFLQMITKALFHKQNYYLSIATNEIMCQTIIRIICRTRVILQEKMEFFIKTLSKPMRKKQGENGDFDSVVHDCAPYTPFMNKTLTLKARKL